MQPTIGTYAQACTLVFASTGAGDLSWPLAQYLGNAPPPGGGGPACENPSSHSHLGV